MSLLFTEGFDSYPNPIPLWYKWNSQKNATRVPGTAPGGFGMQPGFFDAVPKTVAISTSMIVGVAIKPTNTGNMDYQVLFLYDDMANQIVGLSFTNFNQVYITDSTGTIDNTTFSLPLNQWSYLEIKILSSQLNAPAGNVQVRGTVGNLAAIFYTSPATRNYGSRNNICTAALLARGNQQYDDFYICDMNGSVNNNFLGAIKIKTVFPTGNGAVIQLNPVGAGTNYQAVNDPQLTPDVTYVDSRVIGDKDLYKGGGFALTPGNHIAGVCVNAVVRKDKSGYGHVKLPVYYNGNESNGEDYFVPVGYQGFQRNLDVNPLTNMPWSTNGINSLQTGVMIS